MTASYQHYATHDESEYPHLWRGVVGAWAPCLGPSGTRLHDHSGRANWGTLTNMDPATDWVVDGGQYALDFDGTNDHVVSSATSASGDISVSFWFSRSQATTARVICNRADLGPTVGFDIFLLSNNAIGVFTGSQLQTSGSVIELNRWHHVVCNFAASGAQIFVDGRSIASSSSDFTVRQSNSNVFIGRFAPSEQSLYTGLLDDLAIRTAIVHVNNVRELYQIGRGGMYTPRRRRRAYSYRPSLRRRLILTGQT